MLRFFFVFPFQMAFHSMAFPAFPRHPGQHLGYHQLQGFPQTTHHLRFKLLPDYPETNRTWPLKMDGWNTKTRFLLGFFFAYFQGRCHVSFRECIPSRSFFQTSRPFSKLPFHPNFGKAEGSRLPTPFHGFQGFFLTRCSTSGVLGKTSLSFSK